MMTRKKYDVDTAWFDRRLEELQFSKRELARRMQIDIRGLWLRLAGRAEIRTVEVKRLAQLLEVPFHEVLRRAGVEVEERRVPVRGYIDAEGYVHQRIRPGAQAAVGPPDLPEATYGLICRTNGGPLAALTGATVFAVQTGQVLPDALGRLAIAQPQGAEARLCVPKRGERLGTYDLDDLCTKRLQAGVRLSWAAPILWIQT